jgi:aminodeoxyfutalosine synthase
MSTLPPFDLMNERLANGERLSGAELTELIRTPDILQIGMLADTCRRRLREDVVTFLRVATRPCDRAAEEGVSPAARELRMTGTPVSLKGALDAIGEAKVRARDRTIAGFSWRDVTRLAAADGMPAGQILATLRAAGLDSLLELPLDLDEDLVPALDQVCGAGFDQLRVTVERMPAAERTPLLLRLEAWQERHGRVQTLSPLPTVLQAFRPTTGYEDVRAVAVARLAAPQIPMIQVDWARYGPKLAQVALTFGADDLDAVSGATDAPDGPRRAPIEELRRNVVAAGLIPAERDGHFSLIA